MNTFANQGSNIIDPIMNFKNEPAVTAFLALRPRGPALVAEVMPLS
jgi:hypothetical protein